jgi:magnesium-transporting ATPase (P-type)
VKLPNGSIIPLTPHLRQHIISKANELGEKPLRTLALAVKEGSTMARSLKNWDGSTASMPSELGQSESFASIESDLTFVVKSVSTYIPYIYIYICFQLFAAQISPH